MGLRRDMIGEISRLTTDNNRLQAENERLARLQMGGPLAAIARSIDDELTEWVDNGYAIDVQTGLPDHSHESVYDQAIERAVRSHALDAVSNSDPEAQARLLRILLTPEQLASAAMKRLGQVLTEQPELVTSLVSKESLDALLHGLKDDARYKSTFAALAIENDKKLNVPPVVQKPLDLKAELEKKGSFSTERLPIGQVVTIRGFLPGTGNISMIGKTVADESNEIWISYQSTIDIRKSTVQVTGLEKYTQFRIGHKHDKKFEAKIIPKEPLAIQKKDATNDALVDFSINMELRSFEIGDQYVSL